MSAGRSARAQKEGISELVLPADCATEAAAIRDLTVYAASSLRQVVEMLAGGAPLPRAAERPWHRPSVSQAATSAMSAAMSNPSGH